MVTPSYQDLYEAVVVLARKGTLQSSGCYVQIERLIKKGAPLNPVEEKQGSLILPLIMAFKNHGEQIKPHLRLLVESGANPMLRGVFNPALVAREDEVADYLLRAMFEAENKGLPMRSEDGSNPLHILMKTNAWSGWDPSVPWMRERYHSAWVQGVNKAGHTPMHALWHNAIAYVVGTDQPLVFYDRAWKETRSLLDYGGTMECIPSSLARPAADLIIEAVGRGLSTPESAEPIFLQAQAAMRAFELQERTTQASAAARPRRI